ncbi:TIGR04438 family Trp-rich protein [Methylibium sp.]|uniref:TIGR04438 family Trp-rich protein n=1 Tax=Methylibium sp. TaxID=2067992 RepID=UPI0039C9036D
MYFLLLGVLLGALKLLDVGPPAAWSWWIVLAPFALAIVWWSWADWSGYTRRKEMDKMDERKEARRHQNMLALGIDPRKHAKRSARAEEYKARRAAKAEKIEKVRDDERKKNRDSILSSRIGDSQMDAGPPREPKL